MNSLIKLLAKSGLLKGDLDYRLVRASMVLIFLLFGYQKWFEYEAQTLIPFISNGPLTSWMYPVFGVRGASWFLGVSEWMIAALLFCGFWNKKAGILGAIGSTATFITTVTIIPFMPDGWAASAGGFPAMTGNVPFLMKDLVLLAVSVYLLKQDVVRVSLSADRGPERHPRRGGADAGDGALELAQHPGRGVGAVKLSKRRYPTRLTKCACIVAVVALGFSPGASRAQAPAGSGACQLEISGNDALQFDKKELKAGADCKEVTVTLKHVGKLPAATMGHNWVLARTADVDAVAEDGTSAGAASGYVKPEDARVIAATKIIGGGESTSVKFSTASLKKGESYTYVCTFPGHSVIMRGTFTLG